MGDVDRRATVHDPLRHNASHPTAEQDAEAVEPGGDVDAVDLRRRPEHRVQVGRERLRAAEERAQPGVGERRVALHGGVEVRRHPVPVRRDGAEGEVGRRSVELPRRAHRLEQPDQQAAALLAVVGVAVRVLDDRQVAVHAVDGLGEQVVVLGGLQRDVDADAAPELARPQARRDHDGLALDVAGVGDDRGDPAVVGAQPGDRHALDDGDAARGGALGQRGRDADRVGATFVGDVRRREDVVDRGDRRQLGHLGRGDLDVVDAEAALEGALAAQRLEPLRRGREVQVADRAEPGGVAGLGLEAGVEVAGVARHPQRGLVDHAGAGDQSGRVPRGPGGELVALDEDDVGDPERAEVVGDAAADHAPTDDDDAGPCRKVSHEPGPYPDRPFSPARSERLTRCHDARRQVGTRVSPWSTALRLICPGLAGLPPVLSSES